jgi:1,5-rhamnosyltransferase
MLKSYPERYQTIIEAYKYFSDLGLRCDFNIVGVNTGDQKYNERISYNKQLSYNEVLCHIQKTKCILEVVQSDQVGTTLRVQEALFYHKRLLTNNINLKNEPWYNENVIKIYTDLCKIDLSFIKNNNPTSNSDYNNIFYFSYKYQFEFIEDYFIRSTNIETN